MTTNQKETIKFIIRHRSRFAESPTIREIVEELKLSGPASAVGIVSKLIELGYLEKDNSTSRTLIPTKKALEEFELGSNDLIFEGSEDEVLVQPSREFERDDVTVSNPTMSTGSYDRLKIESNGTSIKNDVNTIVESVITIAFPKQFNGTSSTVIARKNLAVSLTNVMYRISNIKFFLIKLEEILILGFLCWMFYLIFKEVWASAILAMFWLKLSNK